MTVTVLDSADLVEAVTTGIVPVPKGIAEDNAAQEAKRAAAKGGEPKPAEPKAAPIEAAKPALSRNEDIAKLDDADDPDNVPGEDGLTAREKRIFTPAMQKTVAKKFRAQREAEELATNEYNRGRLAEQRAEQLERENARLKLQVKPEPAVEEVKAPVRENFKTDQEFQDAVIDYRVDQRLKTQQAEAAKRQEEQQQQEILQHAAARIERAIELVPDFKEVTEAVDMNVPPHIASYMQESDMFAELGYHFAKHPDALEKLTEFTANLRPNTLAFEKAVMRSLVEVGKIESTLSPFAPAAKTNGEEPSKSTNGAKPSTETGSAPSKPRVQAPIIRPLSTGGVPQVEKSEEEMNSSEAVSAWQRRNKVSLTARKRH